MTRPKSYKRDFGGKIFTHVDSGSEEHVRSKAKRLRKEGWLVRVLKSPGGGSFLRYAPGKGKYELWRRRK